MQLLPSGKQQFIDANGAPLANGLVYMYAPGTTTPQATYQDAAGTIQNPNPITLDSSGQAILWGAGTYRQVVTKADGTLIWDQTVSSPDMNAPLVNLAASSGANLVGYGTTTVGAVLKTLGAVVSSMAGLRLVDHTKYARAFLTGYYVTGDGGGGAYYYDANDATSPDNGGTIIVAADGARWKLDAKGGWCFEQFGAKGDGTTDDTAAVQAALSAVPANGGRVYAGKPGANYKIVSPITIGNGSITSHSTRNNLRIDGMSQGNSPGESVYPGAGTMFTWAGTAGGVMFNVLGPYSGLTMRDFMLNCGATISPGGDPVGAINAKTGLKLQHVYSSTFENIKVMNFLSPGPGIQLFSLDTIPAGVARGCDDNTFSNVRTETPGLSAVAWDVGGVNPAASVGGNPPIGCSRNLFQNCDMVAGGSGSSLVLRFADNITFIQCRLTNTGSPGYAGTALTVTPGANQPGFPLEVSFFNCSRAGQTVISPSWAPNQYTTGGITFLPTPFGDDTIHNKVSNDGFYGMMPTRARFMQAGTRANVNTTVPIPNATNFPIAWGGAAFNTDAFWSAGQPTRMTATCKGMYSVYARAILAVTAATSQTCYLFLRVNGTTAYAIDQKNFTSGGSTALGVQDFIYLNAGDYVEAVLYQASGASLNMVSTTGNGNDIVMGMFLVGV